MIPPFNEFGKPTEEIDQLAHQMERMAADFLQQMVKDGNSATEIRAVSEYLSGCVGLAGSIAVMDVGCRIRKEKLDNAPEINDEEALYLANFMRYHNDFDKNAAIKKYIARTGIELSLAKQVADKWIGDNQYTLAM